MIKTVLITGASTGIGEACALVLAERGWRVFAGVRKAADADRLQAQAPDNLTPVFVDITQAEQIDALAEQLAELVGDRGLDGLVNNAGTAVAGPMEAVPMAQLKHQFEVNFFGHVAVTQAMLPLLRRAKGRVVNMSSLSGQIVPPFFGPYAASKHALEVFGDALRVELAPWGIKVVNIEPGSIATPIWEKGLSTNKAMLNNLPPEMLALYGRYFGAVTQSADNWGQRGIPARQVGQVVHKALTTRLPAARYPVGLDAKLMIMLHYLVPTWLWDLSVVQGLRWMARNEAGRE